MADFYDLDERRPHLTITVSSGDVHVIPVSVFQQIAIGSLTVDVIEGRDEILSVVISEWLYFISKNVEE